MKGKKLMAMLMAGSLLLAGLTGCGGANAKGGGAAASADDYPNGPVTIICPWGVGGGADVISRKISEVAKNYFDQPIIVENHTGASGTIGMMDAMDADADGYTMVVTNGPLFSLTPKYIDVSYELSNFTMLRGMRQVALMILTNPQKSGMKTFDDLINYGKTHKITYATSSGPGGDQYVVSSAMFKSLGIEAEPVVMGSEAESINAVVSGQVDCGLGTPPAYYSHQEEGTVQAVATFYPETVQTPYGEVKSIKDWDVDVEFAGMDCLAVRSDVPQEIVDKLNAMLDDVYADSKFTGFMDEMGYPLWDAKGDEVTKFIEDQMDSMDKYVEMFEFPQLQGTPAWMLLLLLYSEQTTAAARTPLLDALLMQMAPMAHGFELCAPDAAFSLATEVLQHLNLCFAEELSLTELTNRFHVSTSHMIHMFKAQFGLPPIQYMVRRRIGEAQHLLRTTEDSAGDIAGQVGMINRNYFYRMFKRLVGVSPVRYREVIGERPDMLA